MKKHSITPVEIEVKNIQADFDFTHLYFTTQPLCITDKIKILFSKRPFFVICENSVKRLSHLVRKD